MADITISQIATLVTSLASSDLIMAERVSDGVTVKCTKANALGAVLTGGGTIATGGFTFNIPASGTAMLLSGAQSAAGVKTFIDGIKFGTDTLNYYEHQVSWTPVLADATSGGNVATADTIYGHYTRIGKSVWLSCRFTNIDTTGMTSGNALAIRGIPADISNVNAGYTPVAAVLLSNVTFSGSPIVFTNGNLSFLRIWLNQSAGAGTAMLVSALSSGSADIAFTLYYEID